jgi:hypothetical protein
VQAGKSNARYDVSAEYYSSSWEDLMGSPVLSRHRR